VQFVLGGIRMEMSSVPLDVYQFGLTGSDLHFMLPDGRVFALDYPVRPRVRDFGAQGGGARLHRILANGTLRYRQYLRFWHSLTPFFRAIPLGPTGDGKTPFWLNGWFPILDPISLCALLVHRRPRRYIEIGSGNSTMFARKAIDAFDLGTKVISIDPEPRAEVDELCDQVLRIPAEDLPTSFTEAVGADDMLFVDNSHRAFPNSDVTAFFLEILPGLPSGTLYGLYDIFLLNDYPEEWLNRYYSEQYMLGAYLLGGGDRDSILFPCNFVSHEGRDWPELVALIDATPLRSMPPGGACFWAVKG